MLRPARSVTRKPHAVQKTRLLGGCARARRVRDRRSPHRAVPRSPRFGRCRLAARAVQRPRRRRHDPRADRRCAGLRGVDARARQPRCPSPPARTSSSARPTPAATTRCRRSAPCRPARASPSSRCSSTSAATSRIAAIAGSPISARAWTSRRTTTKCCSSAGATSCRTRATCGSSAAAPRSRRSPSGSSPTRAPSSRASARAATIFVPGRGEGPYVVAAQLLTDTDIKARTKYDGQFETGPLSDEPDTATYSSQHFKALGRPETWDVAIRVWRLDPGKAQERYDELLDAAARAFTEKDEIASRSFQAAENDIRGVGFLDGHARRRRVDHVRHQPVRVGRRRGLARADRLRQAQAARARRARRSGEVMLKKLASVLALVVASRSPPARGKPQTTHAGLAEQAALASRLHQPARHARLQRRPVRAAHDPARRRARADRRSSPAVADARLGARRARPPDRARVDRRRRRARRRSGGARRESLLRSADRSAAGSARTRGVDRHRCAWRSTLPEHGVPAPDWVIDKHNPFNLAGFLDQYAKAVTAATPGERSRAMARCADRGRRDDARARRSRRAVARARRLRGAPRAARRRRRRSSARGSSGSRRSRTAGSACPARRARSRARTCATTSRSPDGGGLADVIARSYFSPNTLPESTRVGDDTSRSSRARKPALPAQAQPDGREPRRRHDAARADGTCLARYRSSTSCSSFSLDDDCMLEQLAVIMPEVAAYETGLLDFLLRGELAVTIDQGQVAVSAQGPRRRHGRHPRRGRARRAHVDRQVALAGGATPNDQLAKIAMPTYGTRVVAVFSGADPRASRSSRSARCRSTRTDDAMAKRRERRRRSARSRVRAARRRARPGSTIIEPPAAELPGGLPEPLIELYARCDGARIFVDSLEIVPSRDVAFDDGRWQFAIARRRGGRDRSPRPDLARATSRSTTTSAKARGSIAGSPASSTRSR